MASTDKLIRIILKLEDQMSKQLDSATSKLGSMGKKMTSVGQGLTAGLTLPIVGLGTAMFKTFADYEDIMAELQARTQASTADMEAMSDMAIKMGRDTVFSATEAGQAMLELTASGSTAAEAMAMLPDVLNLAAAGSLDLQTAADGVTDIMKQYQLTTEDAVMITNELTKASGSSSATLADLMQGFQNVGTVASQFGLTVNETSAALAVLAENGIKGAESGTALKSMLTNMTRDTAKARGAWVKLGTSMYDAAGNARPINDVFVDINNAMANMTTEEQNLLTQELAGTYGMLAFNSLRASNGISDMQAQMLGASDAATVADARMNTLSGKFASLMGSLETLSIVMGGLGEGPLKTVIEMLTNAVNSVTSFAEANPKLAQTIMLVVGALALLGPILMIIGSIASGVSALIPIFTVLAGVIAGLSAPILLVIAAVGLLVAAYMTNFMGLRDFLHGIVGTILDILSMLFLGDFKGMGFLEEDNWIVRFLVSVHDALVFFAGFIMNPIGNILEILSLLILGDFKGIGSFEEDNWLVRTLISMREATIQFANDSATWLGKATNTWSQNFAQMGNIFDKLKPKLAKFAVEILPKLIVAFKQMIPALKELGVQIMAGLITGITSKAVEFVNAIKSMAEQAKNAVKSAFKIQSPSKVMLEMGQQVVAGFNNGVEGSGGIGVETPSMSSGGLSFAGTSMGGIHIQNLNVPVGTTQEQVNAILAELSKRVKRQGGKPY